MARRYIPPIPLEIIMDNPKTIGLSSTGMGALIRIAWHFWTSDCRPLPTDRVQLFSLSQANRPTWAAYREDIMAILADATVEMIKARELRNKQREAMKRISERGAGSTVLASLARKIQREQGRSREAAPAPRLSETERAARVTPPVVKPKVEGGFSDRRIG